MKGGSKSKHERKEDRKKIKERGWESSKKIKEHKKEAN